MFLNGEVDQKRKVQVDVEYARMKSHIVSSRMLQPRRMFLALTITTMPML